MKDISHRKLLRILHYEPGTGVFTYRVKRGHHEPGMVAGRISPKSNANGGGYRLINIDRRDYGAHRLAWFYVNGAWPKDQLDHINMRRDDDRIVNLREATRIQNLANRDKYANNTSGMKGVSYHKAGGKWRADIQVANKPLFLGLFHTKERAQNAYELAAYLHHGEFSRV